MPSPSGPTPDSTPKQSQTSHSHSKEKTRVKTQTFMDKYVDKWVEPPVAAAAPSYTDHGGLPYGVLDGMQALGDLPSAKVKGRVKGEGARKSVLGRASAVEAPEGQETPQPPTPQPADLPAPLPPIVDDEKDDDYAPKLNGKRRDRTTRNRSAKRMSQPASSVTPVPVPAPAPAQTLSAAPAVRATPTPAPIPSPVAASPAMQYSAQPSEYGGDKLKRVVEAAKARAIEVGKPDLAAAVNEIYEQSQSDVNLRILLQAILSQRASPDQNTQFQDYVRAAKKKLKDAKQKERQHPATPKAIETQSKPTPKTFSKPLSLQSTPLLQAPGSTQALPSTELAEPPRSKISLTVKSPTKHPHQGQSGKGVVMGISPRKTTRAHSVGSESSLTDLTSNDEMDTDEEGSFQGPQPSLADAVKANGPNVRDQVAERGLLTVPPGGGKRNSAEAEMESERDDQLHVKKQKMGELITRDYHVQESSVRPSASAPGTRIQQVRSEALAPKLNLRAGGSRTGSARPSRAVSMDIDSPLSSPAASRQSTPRVLKPVPKPFGKRAKTKQSPEKKQLGGLGAVGGALRESPVGDDNEERSENNDYCSACHGNGYLLCCDGCDRSFHFTCLDPPLNSEAKELDEPWFCFVCVANRPLILESPEKGHTREGRKFTGLFIPLFRTLKKRNPTNFELPQELREHFEGVATDKNGTFVEALNNKPSRNRPGYSEEQPDYVKLRDNKGNLVTCYSCRQSSQSATGPKRAIVTCDHCHENWHLDCLDPPLANPPALNQNGKKVHDWMCPLHADQELRNVPMSQLNRSIHIRKPKAAKVVQTALSRGHRNNGIIEVADDESDTSDSEFYDLEQEGGVVYKLPSMGIKLDFIDKVKSTRVQELRDEHVYSKRARLTAPPTPPLERATFTRRPFNEQQAALNLARFASQNHDLDLGADQVQNLVGALIAEAPAAVVEGMTAAAEQARSASAVPLSSPSSEQVEELSEGQRKELQMLQELIRRKLEGNKT